MTSAQIAAGIAGVQAVSGKKPRCSARIKALSMMLSNANPNIHKAAIAAGACGRREVAVLGDMFELGENEKELHAQVGAQAARSMRVDRPHLRRALSEAMYSAAKGGGHCRGVAF